MVRSATVSRTSCDGRRDPQCGPFGADRADGLSPVVAGSVPRAADSGVEGERMSKPTEGPWRVLELDCQRCTIEGEDGQTAVVVLDRSEDHDSKFRDATRADANLIAAAPDLLESLILFADAWSGAQSGFDGLTSASSDLLESAEQLARAVIAKATVRAENPVQ